MNTEDKMEMLRWLSLRNTHMAPSDLAFLLDIPLAEEEGNDMRMVQRSAVSGVVAEVEAP